MQWEMNAAVLSGKVLHSLQVQSHSVKKSSKFARVTYSNRERWYLGGGSGQTADEKYWAFFWGIMCQKDTTEC